MEIKLSDYLILHIYPILGYFFKRNKLIFLLIYDNIIIEEKYLKKEPFKYFNAEV